MLSFEIQLKLQFYYLQIVLAMLGKYAVDDRPGSLRKSDICGRPRTPNVNKHDGSLWVRY